MSARPQLSCSKMLFKQEEEIMREFGKIKMLLDTADIDEDEWDRTRGSCELLGGRLQQIRHVWDYFFSHMIRNPDPEY